MISRVTLYFRHCCMPLAGYYKSYNDRAGSFWTTFQLGLYDHSCFSYLWDKNGLIITKQTITPLSCVSHYMMLPVLFNYNISSSNSSSTLESGIKCVGIAWPESLIKFSFSGTFMTQESSGFSVSKYSLCIRAILDDSTTLPLSNLLLRFMIANITNATKTHAGNHSLYLPPTRYRPRYRRKLSRMIYSINKQLGVCL